MAERGLLTKTSHNHSNGSDSNPQLGGLPGSAICQQEIIIISYLWMQLMLAPMLA